MSKNPNVTEAIVTGMRNGQQDSARALDDQALTLALCELAGIDPMTTTRIAVEFTAGDTLATIRFEGTARVDVGHITDAINALRSTTQP